MNITDGSNSGGGEGLCLYRAPSGTFFAFQITRAGAVKQIRLADDDRDGRVEGRIVRSFSVGSEAEGCVADAEGLALVRQGGPAGLLLASAQGTSNSDGTATRRRARPAPRTSSSSGWSGSWRRSAPPNRLRPPRSRGFPAARTSSAAGSGRSTAWTCSGTAPTTARRSGRGRATGTWQLWSLDLDIAAPGGGFSLGTRIHQWDCGPATHLNQIWNFG